MSVLKSIKGTLQNVQNDIATGFKSLSVKEKHKKEDENWTAAENKTLDAGAKILDKYQDQWAKMHEASEANAANAEAVDCGVTALFLRLERENAAVTQFLDEVVLLPELVHHLHVSLERIGDLEVKISELDEALAQLQDVCDTQKWQSNRRHHEHQLLLYQQRRGHDLEQTKGRLAKEHSKKEDNYEQRLRTLLRDKQQSFEETYQQEIEHYKVFGETQMKATKLTDDHPNLADISLEQDQAALDDFLKSDEIEPVASSEVTQATDSTPTEEMDESEKSASDETQHTELNELPHEPIKSSDATHTVESPSSDETSR